MYSLLIADDEDLIRESLASHIAWDKMGFKVVFTAENGAQAIEYVKSNQVDVILTDIKMPFATGIEIARFIHEQNLMIRVVVLSGYKEFDLAKSAMEYGVKNYLLKPTKLDDIYKTFHSLKLDLDRENEQKRSSSEFQKNYNEAVTLLKQQMLTDLLYIRSRYSDFSGLEKYGISLDKKYFRIGIVEICNYDHFVSTNWNFEKDLLIVALNNIISKTLSSELNFYTVQIENERLCLILNGDSSDTLISHFTLVQKNVEELLGTPISVHVSQIFEGTALIATEFEKLQAIGCNPVVYKKTSTSDTPGETDEHRDIEYPVLKEHLLLSYLNTCDLSKVLHLVDDIFEVLCSNSVTKEDINIFCTEFLVGLSRYLKDIKVSMNHVAGYKVNLQMDFSAMGTVDIIKSWFKDLCSKIVAYTQKDQEVTDKKIIAIIKEYIHQNFHQDISLNTIADLVHLNPVYASKFFKKQTDENFIDYLVQVRLEKAKEYLKDVTLKIADISKMVGYKSNKHFLKSFKSYTGNTPSEYRDKILDKGLGQNG